MLGLAGGISVSGALTFAERRERPFQVEQGTRGGDPLLAH